MKDGDAGLHCCGGCNTPAGGRQGSRHGHAYRVAMSVLSCLDCWWWCCCAGRGPAAAGHCFAPRLRRPTQPPPLPCVVPLPPAWPRPAASPPPTHTHTRVPDGAPPFPCRRWPPAFLRSTVQGYGERLRQHSEHDVADRCRKALTGTGVPFKVGCLSAGRPGWLANHMVGC